MGKSIKINVLPGRQVDVSAASVKRQWMENTPDRFAYRCLPLNIANAHGWVIGCDSGFRVKWGGGEELESLEFEYENENDPPAISHFGSGIITFHIHAVLTTDPGVSVLATGPLNEPRAHISPLTGIIETDWLPFTFTMNWKMTTPDQWVTFEKGDPFCMIFPVELDDIESYDIEVAPISENPELERRHAVYAKSRADFLALLKAEDPVAISSGWQRDYFQGRDGDAKITHHRTGLKLKRPKFRDT